MSTLRTNEVEMLDGRGKGAISFDNVSEMQASTVLKVGQKVRTLGYYTPGDGGGNDYEIVAAGTGTDDGGSFIDLSGSGLQAKGLFGKDVNVRKFGATGGGVVSDAVPIQNAVSFAGAGSSVVIPAGRYVIDTQSHDGVVIDEAGDREIIGVGATIVTPSESITGRPLVVRGVSGVRIHGIQFECEIPFVGDFVYAMGISVLSASQVTIHDCSFTGFTRYGVLVAQDSSSPSSDPCDDFEIFDCTFKMCGAYAIQSFPKVLSTHQIIRNNLMIDCGNNVRDGSGGQALKVGQGYIKTTVADNTFVRCGMPETAGVAKSALVIGSWSDVNVTGNRFYDCLAHNIAVIIGVHELGEQGLYHKCVIANNTFSVREGISYPGFPYIQVNGTADGKVIYDASKGAVSIKNNTFNTNPSSEKTAINVQPGAYIQRFSAEGNTYEAFNGVFLASDNSFGGGLDEPVISRNTMNLSNPSGGPALIRVLNSIGGIISFNCFTGCEEYSLRLGDHTGDIIVADNLFFLCNISSTSNRGPVLVTVSNTPSVIRLYGNSVSSGDYDLFLRTGSAYTIYHTGVRAPALTDSSAAILVPE